MPTITIPMLMVAAIKTNQSGKTLTTRVRNTTKENPDVNTIKTPFFLLHI